MDLNFYNHLETQLKEIEGAGLLKKERVIASAQGKQLKLMNGTSALNLCANNYLGLANHPALITAAHAALDQYGYGMASVRFICGTQSIHTQLEQKISQFLNTEDTILYSSCFDANTGLFETLLGEEDAILSDALNHASIIDGVRLCKAKRFRYPNHDMQALEKALQDAQSCRFRLIATDGVFSMDGTLARLPEICALAKKYNALVMVDDSHAVGCIGPGGRGTAHHFGVEDQVDMWTGTLGKALGGASGGYVSGKASLVAMLRQRSRPYLFSNTLAPMIAATSIAALDYLAAHPDLQEHLLALSAYFRKGLTALGFTVLGDHHPIIPVLLKDATRAQTMAAKLLEEGVYVIGFSYPVVPMEQARIRTQMSAALTFEDLDFALNAFARVGQSLGIITK